MGSPTVSVILPVYNGADYLSSAIDSVLGQTFQDYELIVVDDGSTDSTPAVVSAYGDRVRYIRQDNGGVASAFNHGIRLALGRYISWLSHDDVFLPAKLEMQVQALSRRDAPAVCYTDIQFIDAAGGVTREIELQEYAPGEALRTLLAAGPLGLAAYSLFFDRRCVEEVGLYDESQRYTQDADMLIRLARRFPFVHVPQKLMRIRQHDRRGSLKKRWAKEAFKFYLGWADKLGPEELFPETSAGATSTERAKARLWLADRYAALQTPPYRKLAVKQYMKAWRESAASLPTLAGKIIGLGAASVRHFVASHRQFYRLGLRTAIARRYARARPGKE